MYELLLTIHLLAVIAFVGGGVTLHVMGRFARAEGGERIVSYTREADKIGSRFYATLSVILLAAGLLLVGEGGYEFSELWISLGLAGWLFSFAIGVGFYGGQQKRLEAAVEAEGPDGQGVRDVFERVKTVNMIELGILLTVVVIMVYKPEV